MKRVMLILALVLATTVACHRTHIIHGGGGGMPSPTYFDRWYSNVVLGIADISGPVDLSFACNGGPWTEIFIRRSFINSIVWAITVGLWTPTLVTIYCGGGPGTPGGYALDGVVDGSTGTFYPAPKTAATTGKVNAGD